MKKPWVLVGLVACMVMFAALCEGAVYTNDFENLSDPLSEWSSTSTEVTPGTVPHPADRFLGRFAEDEAVSLTLTGLPVHSVLTVSFDLYVITTWDGNGTQGPDVWDLSVSGGPTLLHTTFSNVTDPNNDRQAYPDEYPGGDYPARQGAAENNTLGYTHGDPIMDSVYSLSFFFTHSSSSLVLNFSGSGLQTLDDESWGVDNVTVDVIPEPAGLGLFGLALLAVRRKRA